MVEYGVSAVESSANILLLAVIVRAESEGVDLRTNNVQHLHKIIILTFKYCNNSPTSRRPQMEMYSCLGGVLAPSSSDTSRYQKLLSTLPLSPVTSSQSEVKYGKVFIYSYSFKLTVHQVSEASAPLLVNLVWHIVPFLLNLELEESEKVRKTVRVYIPILALI